MKINGNAVSIGAGVQFKGDIKPYRGKMIALATLATLGIATSMETLAVVVGVASFSWLVFKMGCAKKGIL